VLGFADGAFNSDAVANSNIAACRLDSIRMGNNATLFFWHSWQGYSLDKVVQYTAQSLTQSYPYSFHCYYSYDAVSTFVADNAEFLSQSIEEILTD